MNEPTSPTLEETPVRESVLASRMNIPRAKLKEWRENGTLTEGSHWTREDGGGGAYMLTGAGIQAIMDLVNVKPEQQAAPLPTVEMLAISPGAMSRVLRCRPVAGGPLVSVRLTGSRVFGTSFRRGDRLHVVPTGVEGVFEYDGAAPRRMKL